MACALHINGNRLFLPSIHVNVTSYRKEMFLKLLKLLSKLIVFWKNLSLFWEFPFINDMKTSSSYYHVENLSPVQKSLLVWLQVPLCLVSILLTAISLPSWETLTRRHPPGISNLLPPFINLSKNPKVTSEMSFTLFLWHYSLASPNNLLFHPTTDKLLGPLLAQCYPT